MGTYDTAPLESVFCDQVLHNMVILVGVHTKMGNMLLAVSNNLI